MYYSELVHPRHAPWLLQLHVGWCCSWQSEEESGSSLLHDLSVSKNKNKLEIYILLPSGDVCALQHCFQFCVMSIVSSELYGISMNKLFLSDRRCSFERYFEFCRKGLYWILIVRIFQLWCHKLGNKVCVLIDRYSWNLDNTICCQFQVTSRG